MKASRESVPRYLKWIVPIAAVVCLVAWGYVTVRTTHAWDDAEPEILNQAWRLASGSPLYPPIDEAPFLHTAYPPVYFGLVASMLKVTGLSYIPAKIVSLISVLLIGLAISSIASTWGVERRSAWWMLCLLILLPAFLYNTTRVHVQMLAVAFSLTALALFHKRSSLALTASAVAAVLAIYTKQTQIAAPLAIVCWLAFNDVRRVFIYLGTVIVLGVPFYSLLQAETNGLFLEHTFSLNRLAYSMADVPFVLLHWAGPLFLLIGIAASDVAMRARQRSTDVVDVYFAIVLVITAITCGRLGAHSQYVIELAVAAVLIILRRLTQSPWSNRLVQLQAVILLVYAPLFVSLEEGRSGMASNRAAPRVHQLIATSPGPVLSEQGSFPLFRDEYIPIQLFDFTALARQGRWDMNKLRAQIDAKLYPWVITEFAIENGQMTSDDRERFTPEIVAALKENYVRVESIPPYFIYRPVSR
jgi:hypothetical protein